MVNKGSFFLKQRMINFFSYGLKRPEAEFFECFANPKQEFYFVHTNFRHWVSHSIVPKRYTPKPTPSTFHTLFRSHPDKT